MTSLKQVCDLEYLILSCMINHYELLKLNCAPYKNIINRLKLLYKEINYVKDELLDMHECFFDEHAFRMEWIKTELNTVKGWLNK